MIISKLQGGLGNQIFQWCYGKYLSVQCEAELYLDLSFYSNKHHYTPRNFSLHKFPNLVYEEILDIPENRVVLTDSFVFKEITCQENVHYYLDGYWQSEKYFKEIENIVRHSLEPPFEICSKYNLENSVSIHIRRTDYVASNGYHPVQPLDYYKKGLDLINEYDKILVFSDDINWCKNNLDFKNLIFVEGNEDIEDLWIMSMCNHNIICNSSFSWWAAWLNKNKNKKIIAPSKWFGNHANLNEGDIIPNNWIKI